MPIDIIGLKAIQKDFQKFNFRIPNIQSRFLDVIATESLQLLKLNTPKDTGSLSESWIMEKSSTDVVIYNEQEDLIFFITEGSIRHVPNPFISVINKQVDNMVMDRLQGALSENHRWFIKLQGGKGRKFQQVGRSSAGFRGGTSFAGRSSLVRAGTGRKQLKRRLSLRRRKGKSINSARKDVKFG